MSRRDPGVAVLFALGLVAGVLGSAAPGCNPCGPELPPFPQGDYRVIGSFDPWRVGLVFHFEAVGVGHLKISYVDEQGRDWFVEYWNPGG